MVPLQKSTKPQWQTTREKERNKEYIQQPENNNVTGAKPDINNNLKYKWIKFSF